MALTKVTQKVLGEDVATTADVQLVDNKAEQAITNSSNAVTLATAAESTANAASAKVDAIEASNNAGYVGFLTQADMLASLDYDAGTLAQVISDPNRANNGTYRKYGVSGMGSWTKAAEPISEQALALAEKAMLSVTAPASIYPNLVDDPTMHTNTGEYQWSNHKPAVHEGIPCAVIGDGGGVGTTTSYRVEDAQLVFDTGFISGFMTVLAKIGASGIVRVMVLQYDSGGTELSRVAFQENGPFAEPKYFIFNEVPLEPTTDYVLLYADCLASGDYAYLTSASIANGGHGGFRDTDKGAVALGLVQDISAEYATPNVFTDYGFTAPQIWHENATRVWDSSRDRWALAVPGTTLAARSSLVTEDMSEAGKVAFGMTIRDKLNGFTSGRMVVVQYDDTGAELDRVDKSVSSLASGTRVTGTMDINPSCETISFFVHNQTTDDNSLLVVSDIVLRAGTQSNMIQAPPEPIPLFNQFSDTALIGGAPYGSEYQTRVSEDGVRKIKLATCPIQAGVRWTQPATGALAPGKTVYASVQSVLLSPDRGADFSMVLIFLDSVGSELSRATAYQQLRDGSAAELVVAAGTVPANCTEMQIRPSWWGTAGNPISGEISEIALTSGDPRFSTITDIPIPDLGGLGTNKVYVSPTGDDVFGAGTAAAPLRSLGKAAEALGGAGIILMEPGTYNGEESIESQYNVNLTIMPTDGTSKPRITAGTRLTDFALNSGDTDVYVMNTSILDGTSKKWIWEGYLKDEETLITNEEREPQHNGRTHRLEHTKLRRQSSLAALRAEERGFYADGAGKLYIKVKGTYADISEAHIYVPSNLGLSARNGDKCKIMNVVVDFGSIRLDNTRDAEVWYTESVGSGGQGLVGDTAHVKVYGHRSGGSDNDGMNWHNTLNVDVLGASGHIENPWCHDCGDDGDSMHEHCVGTYFGGLFEFNQDRGSAPSYGSHVVYHNVKTRKNGYLQGASGSSLGEGIGLVGSNSEAGTVGTSVRCIGCVDVGSVYGFANHGTDASNGQVSSMELVDCHSEASRYAAYSSKGGGKITMRRCTELDSENLVLNGSENITIKNGNLVS